MYLVFILFYDFTLFVCYNFILETCISNIKFVSRGGKSGMDMRVVNSTSPCLVRSELFLPFFFG